MTVKPRDRGGASTSTIHGNRAAPILVAGLTHDEVYRGVHRARALRAAYFKTMIRERVGSPSCKLAIKAGESVTDWLATFNRGTFAWPKKGDGRC